MKNNLFFRANGNAKIGIGHIMRTLALIEMLKKRYNCTLILNQDAPLEILPNNLNYILINSKNILNEVSLIKKIVHKNAVLILDGYDFDNFYQEKVKPYVKKLVVVDDFRNNKHNCDILINHGVKSIAGNKSIKNFCGFQYLILREHFLKSAQKQIIINREKNVFVCLGGSDPYNITFKILKALKNISEIEKVFVIIGAANKSKEKLIYHFESEKIHFYSNLSSNKIIKLLKKSFIGISTSSTMALEICTTHTPLICGRVNNNQRCIDNYIVSENCGISVGNWKKISVKEIKKFIYKMFDKKLLKNIANNQQKKIDGKSKKRYINIFNQLFYE